MGGLFRCHGRGGALGVVDCVDVDEGVGVGVGVGGCDSFVGKGGDEDGGDDVSDDNDEEDDDGV